MANMFQNALIAALIATFTISMFLLPLQELNDTYGSNINLTSLEALDELNEVSSQTTGIKNQVTKDSKVSTEASIVDFSTNAFTVGKFILTGGPIKVINGLLVDFSKATGVSSQVYIFLISIITLVLSFALVKSIVGR